MCRYHQHHASHISSYLPSSRSSVPSQRRCASVLSTDRGLIPARNASLAEMHGSASFRSLLSNVKTFAPQRKIWTRLLQCLNCTMFAVRLWITTSPYRWPIGSLPSTFMLWTPPHCTKDVYTPQGSTRDLWTVCTFFRKPGLHGTWASRVVLASVNRSACEERKRGRSLKREPT
jgi:hypothetical protein